MASAAVPDIYIDFLNTGSFGDYSYDDVGGRARVSAGVVVDRGRDGIRAISPPMAGEATFLLDNRDGIFDPGSSSPLAGKVRPGRRVYIDAHVGVPTAYDSPKTYDGMGLYDGSASRSSIWSGFLRLPSQNSTQIDKTTSFTALGLFSKLVGIRRSTLVQTGLYTGQALSLVFQAAGWPSSKILFDVGQTLLPFWWMNDDDCWAMAQTLWSTEGPGASLYEDADGNAVFEDRDYRLTAARCLTPQYTFSGDIEPAYAPIDGYSDGQKDVINVCTVKQETRSAKASGVVWTYGATITLAAGVSKTVTATTTDPFVSPTTPSSGGGDFTVSAGSVSSVLLTQSNAVTAEITLIAGGAGATVTGLRLRAQTISVDESNPITNTVDTSASIDEFGEVDFPYPLWPVIDKNVAQDFVNVVVQSYQYGVPQDVLTIYSDQFGSVFPLRSDAAINSEINDRVRIINATTSLDSEFFLNRKKLAWTEKDGGYILQALLYCEAAVGDTTDFARWGTAVWGTSRWAF